MPLLALPTGLTPAEIALLARLADWLVRVRAQEKSFERTAAQACGRAREAAADMADALAVGRPETAVDDGLSAAAWAWLAAVRAEELR